MNYSPVQVKETFVKLTKPALKVKAKINLAVRGLNPMIMASSINIHQLVTHQLNVISLYYIFQYSRMKDVVPVFLRLSLKRCSRWCWVRLTPSYDPVSFGRRFAGVNFQQTHEASRRDPSPPGSITSLAHAFF